VTGDRIGWARLSAFEPAPACEAPRHESAPPTAEWRVALTEAGGLVEFSSLCGGCVAVMAGDLGITVEQGTLAAPPWGGP
jgi:hypothetical protein